MRNISDRNVKETTDDTLRRLMKANAMQAPPSPWFTRKVMNRLPRKRVRTFALVEYCVYILAAVATIVFAIFYALEVRQTGQVTVGNITMMAICFCLFCSIVYLCIEPWLSDDTLS